jgi:hypothetical protein
MVDAILRGGIMRRRTGLAVAMLLVAAAPVTVPPAAAAPSTNAVVAWDLHAKTAIWDYAQQLPWEQGRSFAMVNGAVYDAVNAIAGTPYQPYLGAPRTTGRESTDAAVATAAYRVLDHLFPAQADRLREQYDQALARIPDGHAKRGGVAVGDRTAATMIAARLHDGSYGDQQWVVGTAPGQWRPTPPAFASGGAWLPFVKPFLVPSAAMFRTAGPPALTSAAYARDVNEVKLLGAAASTARTPDQTEAAQWWHDRRVVEWEIKRQLATTQRLSTLRTARLFAMADLTTADTQIACFDDKRAWSFWRPITAIHLADTDGNPATTADPQWTSLLVAPPFPDLPSGHACGTTARMATYQTFFGRDRIAYSAYSEVTGTRRHYGSFSQGIEELMSARVWGGIHFRTASVRGDQLGRAVSDYVTAHHFQKRHP